MRKLLPVLTIAALLPLLGACEEEQQPIEDPAADDGETAAETTLERISFDIVELSFTIDTDFWENDGHSIDPQINAETARFVNPETGAYLDVRCQTFDKVQTAEDLDWIVEDKLFELSAMPEFEELANESAPFAGTEARRLEFRGLGDGVPWRFVDYNALSGPHYIGVQLAAPTESWDAIAEQRAAVLESLELPEPTPAPTS